MSVEEMALNLPRAEKLRLMEALWEDLSSDSDSVQSPVWHEEALRNTEARFNAGDERAIDWNEAKRILGSGR